MEANNPNPTDYIEQLWLQRIARTGTSCGSGVYRTRGNPARFFDFGCLITNPLKPPLDLLQDANFLARESVRRGSQFLASTKRLGKRVLDQINLSSFVAMEPFQDVLQNSIRFDLIQRSKRYIRIGAVRWDIGFVHYFTNSDLTVDIGPKIVQASAAVPGFFPRVSVNGVEYADGGVIENSPLQGAVEANADVLHVVTSLPQTADVPADLTVNTLDTLYRMLVINVTKSLRRDIERYRNVNDALLVLQTLRESGNTGPAYEMLQQLLDRIMRQDEPDYRRVTIHVYAPPEPMATLFEFVNFDREYLEQLVRKGYHDTLAHNCKLNGCVVPEEHIDPKPTQPPEVYGDLSQPDRVDPGITF
jgi:predicted acylesterase/phospholipase RssA